MLTWPTVYHACCAVLPAWDRWAGDDGRPPAARAATWRYATIPTLSHRAALEQALVGARAAWLLALWGEIDRRPAGVDPAPVAAAPGRRLCHPGAWAMRCWRMGQSDQRRGRAGAASPAALAARTLLRGRVKVLHRRGNTW